MNSIDEKAATEAMLLSTEQKLNHFRIERALSRRTLFKNLGIAGAAIGAGSMLSGCMGSGGAVMAQSVSQTDVLNFALNLEYLEATFYSYVVTGADLPSSSTGGGPAPTGAPTATPTFQTAQIADLFAEIYYDELSHVNDLRTALGASAVARPQLALAALGTVSTANYITFARLFEDVGVTAYAGAATDLTGTNLQYAAQILAVEAFHSGALRLIDIQQGVPYVPTADIPTDKLDVPPLDPGTVALAKAGPTTAGGFFATAGANGQANTLPGFAYTRTTSQVLAIVYGSAVTGTSMGGFFPAGMSGNIKTV